jgi:hypothetical protein
LYELQREMKLIFLQLDELYDHLLAKAWFGEEVFSSLRTPTGVLIRDRYTSGRDAPRLKNGMISLV